MSDNNINRFIALFAYGTAGVLCGILLGYAFGLLIYWLTTLVSSSPYNNEAPVEMVTFLGMGFGGIIGGIFGASVISKKK